MLSLAEAMESRHVRQRGLIRRAVGDAFLMLRKDRLSQGA